MKRAKKSKHFRIWCKVCHGPTTMRGKTRTQALKTHRQSRMHQDSKRNNRTKLWR